MPSRHDLIVIGASAGGVEVLQQLASDLPPDLPAAVVVVLHVQPRSRSLLPEILSRAGPLVAEHPANGAPIEYGRIYVAAPDHHLMIERNHVHLTCGPKEQHHRPCINVTFRSAAAAYRERVIGVVLSGELDDGTSGLWEIERRGGLTVVQNPEETAFPSMPLSALRELEVDHTVSVRNMGSLLTRLVKDEQVRRVEAKVASEEPNGDSHLTDLTCPDCRGTIWEVNKKFSKDYRCRVGHTYSAKTMLAEQYAAQEKALYAAIVALEEGASLTTRLADQFEPEMAQALRAESREREVEAEKIRKLMKERVLFEVG
ncbi:MAG: chemotaxis protein CheB [Acidobacteriaceae bacterium]|nr:chemotaxis protein CheB [Acidobacteriaceae bacterium]MBV9765556.1 chemotaxis protein CheB [Acidobacteriaceae bacterium]